MTVGQQGLEIARRFTKAGEDPYKSVEWTKRDTRITDPDGSVIFEMKDAEIPAGWSQVAGDIMVSKYFRKAGVPVPDGGTGSEHSARQVFDRLAGAWRWWGEEHGYFASPEDARAFEDEMKHMLGHQVGAPNSPQWFNTGLNRAYGLTGPAQGFWYVDPEKGEMTPSPDSYSRPAGHACFILKIEDDLVNPGGIMDLWLREARIFKFGSGAGSNFSDIRAEGEKLSGGGSSSGVMSFLKIGDRAAGAIKSGGTTRRAAKMVILDVDHPDIEEFINWKKVEEDKARLLIEKGGFPADFNGEAYETVSGQNSNNSVRVTNDFIRAVEKGEEWEMTERTTGKVMKTAPAEHLWNSIAEAAWACADPGVQFDTTINEWHTCPEGGRIRGSNPCSEYMFLDNTACNLASLNLVAFYDQETKKFDVSAYLHAIRLWTIMLEIAVTMAHFPSRAIAQGSYDYRTLGLGYANLGSLLMRQGIPYDSPEGRAIAGALTSILTGHAYTTSAEMAGAIGPFPRYAENREAMLRVIRNHHRAAYDAPSDNYEGVSQKVVGVDHKHCPEHLAKASEEVWDAALSQGSAHGYRNAQVSALAPTGCLVGGSLVPTERGLARLGSLGDRHGTQWQDLGIDVGAHEGPKRATKFYVNGAEEVVTVETSRGYRIQGTPTHRIKVIDSETGEWVWKRFGDLEAGTAAPLMLDQLVGEPQRVSLPPLPGEENAGPKYVTPQLAEFVGIYTECGTHLPGNRPEVVERMRYLAKELFGAHTSLLDRGGVTEVIFDSYAIPGWLWECRLARSSEIPHGILATNDPAVYRGYLKGLFNGGGDVLGKTAVWSTHSEGFAREVQSLLLSIGYPSAVERLPKKGSGDPHVVSVGVLPGYGSKFAEEIGFIDQRRQELLENMSPASDAKVFVDEIVGVQLGGEQPTYDLSVPENVSYVANGFVSHNTIGLLMDCDTTGVEPDFSLVKFKKLAGGGHFKIVNRSVGPALGALGYSSAEQRKIVEHVLGVSSLDGAPHVNRHSLRSHGFNDSELDRIEATLPEMFELRHAFGALAIGEDTLRRLGVGPDKYRRLDFDLLEHLGFSADQISEAGDHICGHQAIEGAPHLKDEHLPVFDTANRNGRRGRRLIHHNGHIRMMAAAQPFISGAISKTINMPNEVDPSEIRDAYHLSWKSGLKAIALYRDGSKASQPLSSSGMVSSGGDAPALEEVLGVEQRLAYGPLLEGTSPSEVYAQGMNPPRFLLSPRRKGWTREARVGGHKLFIRTGEYEDGTLGELFIDLAKEGATLRGILSCFAIAVSKGLQYGVPLEEFVDTFLYQTFEPRGMVQGHPSIKMASSMVDYIFRTLAIEYLGRTDLGHAPPGMGEDFTEEPHPEAADRGGRMELRPPAANNKAPPASGVRMEGPSRVAPDAARMVGTQAVLGRMMGDAPMCDECGHITVRNASCYRCLNCGASLGCS